jgi:hypothetical protein
MKLLIRIAVASVTYVGAASLALAQNEPSERKSDVTAKYTGADH